MHRGKLVKCACLWPTFNINTRDFPAEVLPLSMGRAAELQGFSLCRLPGGSAWSLHPELLVGLWRCLLLYFTLFLFYFIFYVVLFYFYFGKKSLFWSHAYLYLCWNHCLWFCLKKKIKEKNEKPSILVYAHVKRRAGTLTTYLPVLLFGGI